MVDACSIQRSADQFEHRLIVIPLSFLRRLDSLKYTSVVALISIGYLVILVVAHFIKGDTKQDRGDIRVAQPESAVAVLSSFPVIVFAYTCHQNVRALVLPLSFHILISPSDVLNTERDWQQFAFQNHRCCHRQHRCCSFPICTCCYYWLSILRQCSGRQCRRNV